MLKKRTSGILQHISSLPTRHGIGDLGPAARKFADFLQRAGMHLWQILPLTITQAQQGFSPYSGFSAFAGNPLLISPEALVEDRWLRRDEIAEPPRGRGRLDLAACTRYKADLFRRAYARFQRQSDRADYDRFVADHESWLADFALFMALKDAHGHQPWAQWPTALRNRRPQALAQARRRLQATIDYHQFLQYVFARQYAALKRYCNERRIELFGDLPIYVTYDSADVWAAPQWFKLTRSRRPRFIAGVPPDYFSRTGQLWGNPVYDWERQASDGYSWWMRRLRHHFALYDLLRIDHFRAFESYWQVPAGQRTALKGRWVKGPADDFLRTMMDYYPQPALVVEDLGEITPAVRELIGRYAFPVMKVLQFAFDGDYQGNTHLPHNHVENALVYTGTHDNNTIQGWRRRELTAGQKRILAAYLGKKIAAASFHWDMIRMALASVARAALIPMQDVLGLDERARMNNPATARGNWRWQMGPGRTNASLADRLRQLVEQYGRY